MATKFEARHQNVIVRFSAKTTREVKDRLTAYAVLFEKVPFLSVYGDVIPTDGDIAFLRSPGSAVIKIGRKLLTVSLEYEGQFTFDPAAQEAYEVRYAISGDAWSDRHDLQHLKGTSY